MDAVNAALAERMGVARDDRRPKLVAAVWTAILMTALGQLGPTTDWASVTVDEIVPRLATTFAQFISAITDVRQPV